MSTCLISAFLADTTLAVSGWRRIGIFWRIFVTEIAMSFAEVRAHSKALIEYSALRVKNFLESFALLCSIHQSICLESRNFGKNSGLIGNSFYNYKARVSTIKTLFLAGSPTTILRRIRSIIVNTLDSKSIRTFTHILNEGSKTILPAKTNGNATPAIVSIMRRGWNIATASDSRPDGIKRMLIFEWHGEIIMNTIKIVKENPRAV